MCTKESRDAICALPDTTGTRTWQNLRGENITPKACADGEKQSKDCISPKHEDMLLALEKSLPADDKTSFEA